MTLNGKSMLKHLEELDKCIRILREHQHVTKENFLSDQMLQDAACRRLQIATECCIDIGNHIISGHGLKRAETNTEIFKILFDYGYLEDENFVNQMVEMVKFRNLLTHIYLKIDMEKVYSYLQNDLWLFEQFQKMTLKLI